MLFNRINFSHYAKLLLIFVAIALFSNCENKKETAITAPIAKDKMKIILIDLYLAEAAAEMYRITKDSTLLPHKSYYFEDIFKKHHLTQIQYEKAYEYYTARPELLWEIYDEMHTDLNAIEGFENKKPKLK